MLDLSKTPTVKKGDFEMDKKIIDIMEGALRRFIEELIQSENGPSEDDIEYIKSEREYIKRLKAI